MTCLPTLPRRTVALTLNLQSAACKAAASALKRRCTSSVATDQRCDDSMSALLLLNGRHRAIAVSLKGPIAEIRKASATGPTAATPA